jgi:hypothetical protein
MADKASMISQAAVRYDGVVRITIPAGVAYDLDRFTKLMTGIAERLGCRPCFSGAACLFITERNFVVDPQLGIHGIGDSDPMPALPMTGVGR